MLPQHRRCAGVAGRYRVSYRSPFTSASWPHSRQVTNKWRTPSLRMLARWFHSWVRPRGVLAHLTWPLNFQTIYGKQNMIASTVGKPKKRGRPATGRDPLVRFRIHSFMMEEVDRFAVSVVAAGMSEALRALVALGSKRSASDQLRTDRGGADLGVAPVLKHHKLGPGRAIHNFNDLGPWFWPWRSAPPRRLFSRSSIPHYIRPKSHSEIH